MGSDDTVILSEEERDKILNNEDDITETQQDAADEGSED